MIVAAWLLTRCFVHAAAVLGSGVPGADERRVAQVMGAIADRVTDQFINPYTFPSSHNRILEPYNYYDFGQVCMHHYPSVKCLLSGSRCDWTATCKLQDRLIRTLRSI